MNQRNMSIHRPLLIDFDKYTDGDPDFKNALISHLIDNVKELQQSLPDMGSNTSINFIQVLHKIKTTLTMLNDSEFIQTLEEIKSSIISNHPFEFFSRKLKSLSWLCDQVIESLGAEIK